MNTRTIFVALFFSVLISGKITAQATTAMNWTKPECGHGVSVNIFDVLDSGYVVVQDYVMLGSCIQCGIASEEVRDLIAPFNAQYPGKVKFFSCIHDSSASCSDMSAWATTYNLSNTLFIDGTLEFAYYGGYGMPLVVVLGGPNHTVFAQINGYVSTDSTNFKNAVASAIVASGVNELTGATASISVYPSPTNNTLQIKIPGNKGKANCDLFDESGRLVQSFALNGENNSTDVSSLPAGFYFLKVSVSGLPDQYTKFIISR